MIILDESGLGNNDWNKDKDCDDEVRDTEKEEFTVVFTPRKETD